MILEIPKAATPTTDPHAPIMITIIPRLEREVCISTTTAATGSTWGDSGSSRRDEGITGEIAACHHSLSFLSYLLVASVPTSQVPYLALSFTPTTVAKTSTQNVLEALDGGNPGKIADSLHCKSFLSY